MNVGGAVEYYEKIRDQVLGGGIGPRWGQVLLRDHGVAAWLRAVGEFVAPDVAITAAPTEPVAITRPVHDDLVRLMEQAVFAVAEAKES